MASVASLVSTAGTTSEIAALIRVTSLVSVWLFRFPAMGRTFLKNAFLRFPVVSAFGVGIAVTMVVFGVAFLMGQANASRRALPTPMPSFATLTPVTVAAIAISTTPVDPTALVFPDTLPLASPSPDPALLTPGTTMVASPTDLTADTVTPLATATVAPATEIPTAVVPAAPLPPAPPRGGGPKRKPPKH